MNDLITIKQLPIIEENLKTLSEEIQKKVENANALVCTEDTVKEVKQVRADLTKEFKELEEQRKTVKNSIMKPYNDFEELYKEYVSDSYKNADAILKNKIDNVEQQLRLEKETELREFFEEQKNSKRIDFVTFEQMNLNITLSASMKSLKSTIQDFMDRVESELETINLQEFKEEILVEYMKHLNINRAIQDVNERHIALAQVKQVEQVVNEIHEQEQVTIQKVEEVLQAPVIEEKEYALEFVVTATKDKLSKLKEFLEKEGIKYESK